MRKVAILGIGQTAVDEHWDKSLRELAGEAIFAALSDAQPGTADALFIGNMLSGSLNHQENLGSLIADLAGLRHVEAIKIEAACASGAAALRAGLIAVASGDIESALVVGVEKMTDAKPNEATAALATAADADYEAAHGLSFVAINALVMQRYIEELVRLKVDLILSSTTAATRAAKEATSSIPIVFSGVSDPVGSGFVVSCARPGGHITGVMDTGVELTGKRLALLQELLPRMKRVAVLGNPGDTLWEPTWNEAQAAARQLRVEVVPVPITRPDQLDTAFRQLRPRVDALMVAPQPFCWAHKREIIDFALREKLPATYEFKGYVVDGGLMTYAPVYPALYVQAARLVDRIFKGARPADLAVEQPTHSNCG